MYTRKTIRLLTNEVYAPVVCKVANVWVKTLLLFVKACGLIVELSCYYTHSSTSIRLVVTTEYSCVIRTWGEAFLTERFMMEIMVELPRTLAIHTSTLLVPWLSLKHCEGGGGKTYHSTQHQNVSLDTTSKCKKNDVHIWVTQHLKYMQPLTLHGCKTTYKQSALSLSL